MRKYILLLLILTGVASCSSLQDLQLDIETRVNQPINTCVTYDWVRLLYVDCYTRFPILRQPYYGYYNQPIIIRTNPRRTTRVRSRSRRGNNSNQSVSSPRTSRGGRTSNTNAQ